ADTSAWLARDPRVALLSFTGSSAAGREVAREVAARLGRGLLELGGNNTVVVLADADLDMAVRAIVFGAVGTAGQRCTTTRRLIVHERVHPELLERLQRAYASVRIGNPLDDGTLMGPLIDQAAFEQMQVALQRARDEGGLVSGGERVLAEVHPEAWYVRPALVETRAQSD